MALEDYTTYTEVDPTGLGGESGHIQFTANHIDATIGRNEDAWLVKDFEADHFGDFEHKLNVKADDATDWAMTVAWMLSDEVEDFYTLWTGDKKLLALVLRTFYGAGTRDIVIYSMPKPETYYDDSIQLALDTSYYLLIVKSGTSFNVGIYSTAELRDAGDGTDGDEDNLSLTLTADHKYRYLFAVSSWNSGGSYFSNADIDNLDLQEAVSISTSSVVPILKSIGILAKEFKPRKIQFPNLVPRMVI